MTDPLRLLIDTDPGVDDAIALLMALRQPNVTVEALTVCAGNVGLEHTVRNARYIVEWCGADVPVYAGADRALMREARRADSVHGDDGLGNLGLRPGNPALSAGHAVDVIVDVISRNPGAITLVTLGPLTNIALALIKQPEIARSVRRVVMMGGAANVVGNVTPAAEFNVWADPEAARIVLRAGMPLTMAGIELSRGDSRWTEEEIDQLEAQGSEHARTAAALLRVSLAVARRRPEEGGAFGAGVPDGVAMAAALEPDCVTAAGDYHVDVEIHGELTTGETVVDRRGVTGQPANATVIDAIDAARFKAMVRDACR